MAPVLSLILGLSLLLRGIFIPSVPPELFGDEVDVGYQAYSLLATGRDIGGQILPTYIKSLAEWRAPLLMYATVPSIALLGNSVLGVRLPEIILGSLGPLILALLVYQTTKSWRFGVLASLSLCLMPWHIHYSRAAFEAMLLLDLLMLGLISYLRRWHVLSAVFFVLTIYTYNTAVIFTPLLVLGIFLVYHKIPSWKSLALGIALLIPFALTLTSGAASQRFGLVSIFGDQNLIQKNRDLRSFDNSLPAKLLHNLPVMYAQVFLGNYYKSFSPEFLFTSGDPALRHGPQFFGNLLPLTAPLLLLGIYYAVRRKWWWTFLWLSLAPIPAALTIDGGWHSTRLILMAIPLAAFIGAGASQLSRIYKPALVILFALLGFQFAQYYHHYLVVYPKISWRWWQVGYREAFAKVSALSPQYQYVFINNTYEPSLIRWLFWTNVAPSTVQKLSQTPVRFGTYNGIFLPDKYYFGAFDFADKNASFGSRLLPNSLYLLSQRDDLGGDWDWRTSPPGDVQVLDTIVNSFGQPIFYLVTRK